MSTKYHLFIGDVEVAEATRAKKPAVIKIGEATGKPFEVRTDTGALVHKIMKEDLPTEKASPAESPKEGIVVLEWDFPGNYSLVMIPFAQGIAEAFGGIESSWTRTPGRLNRVIRFQVPKSLSKEFFETMENLVKQVFVELTAWQKESVAERRGLTDMQKYLQNREFITEFGRVAAKEIAARR